jgi:superfamily II DNA or RNA helicase
LGSPAIKEGVSLLRVRQVHIIEPYWNMSRLEQVIGRAIRFCSHKDVEPEKRVVKVYIYIATVPTELAKKEKENNKEPTITIDEHIYNMAIVKNCLSSLNPPISTPSIIICGTVLADGIASNSSSLVYPSPIFFSSNGISRCPNNAFAWSQ